MFFRQTKRKKDDKEHRYWSIAGLAEAVLLLDKLKFVLPAQPEPKISAAQIVPPSPM